MCRSLRVTWASKRASSQKSCHLFFVSFLAIEDDDDLQRTTHRFQLTE
jgi:hypothetical protein